jgi:hypothetical protein
MGIAEPVQAGKSVMFAYLGLSAGDLSSGLISQYFRSRKKVVLGFILLSIVCVLSYLLIRWPSAGGVYWVCMALGFSIGYWALFVTIAAEQFGTNIRATVATTVPNFVRGSLIPVTLLFDYFKTQVGIIPGGLLVGGLTFIIALLALRGMSETFGKDLNFIEKH